MPPTIFQALQCFQCSTMQVKQQKKSSNKWNCVVCNQKQSVRKVYAQGFMAKDVRKFVQNFNMSRQLAEQNLLNVDGQDEALGIGDQISVNGKPKRTDWTEYVDPEDDSSYAPYSPGDEFEPKIITELPKPVFKKPKLKSHHHIAKDSADDEEEETSLRKFGGRHTRANIPSHAIGSSRYGNATTVRGTQEGWLERGAKRKCADILEGMRNEQPAHQISEWSGCLIRGEDKKFANELPRRTHLSTAKSQTASKWSCYMTEEEEEEGGCSFVLGRKKGLRTEADYMNNRHVYDTESMDQMVEEDIHPDFL
ncbi:OLC1v1017594C1 [Oldenlandia corymbosa var. corymbosa]|uniref:OLC1v1017594C1 n=1 Tax=Oldenlandia corymbosa var. corymbosa TaxID=529605 RepID=A0AAV1E9S6_OLDCO|nr:OLC1v1017594C1 [Oldenlandia corymbosa var. corymbosa]